MVAALTITPSAPLASYNVVANGTGFSQYKTRLLLDGTVVATICRPTSGAFASLPFSVGAAGTKSLTAEQNVDGVWGSTVATLSITVAAAPTDPSPGTNFNDVPASLIAGIPGGALTYSSGTLAAFFASIPAGGYGVLDTDATFSEDINLALRDGVTIIADTGRVPIIDGTLRISGGVGWRIFGLNGTWTVADPDKHMWKIDGGSGWELGYGTTFDAACFAHIRPGQAARNGRIHHMHVHGNPGPHGGANQDHGIYADPPTLTAGYLIDHNLIEDMPHGRNIKVGGPSSGYSPIGGIEIIKNTLKGGHGPSNSQVSNGATAIHYAYNVLIDSGAATNLTTNNAGLGSTYDHNAGDSVVGPNNAMLTDGGSNLDNVAGVTIANAVTQGAAGRGHLAT